MSWENESFSFTILEIKDLGQILKLDSNISYIPCKKFCFQKNTLGKHFYKISLKYLLNKNL